MCSSQHIWRNCKSKVTELPVIRKVVLFFYLVCKFFLAHIAINITSSVLSIIYPSAHNKIWSQQYLTRSREYLNDVIFKISLSQIVGLIATLITKSEILNLVFISYLICKLLTGYMTVTVTFAVKLSCYTNTCSKLRREQERFTRR